MSQLKQEYRALMERLDHHAVAMPSLRTSVR